MPVVFLNRFIVTRSHFNFKQYLLGHGEDHLVVVAQKHQKDCAGSMRKVVWEIKSEREIAILERILLHVGNSKTKTRVMYC